MVSFLYCSPNSYCTSNYCNSDSCRSFRLLKALTKSNGILIAIRERNNFRESNQEMSINEAKKSHNFTRVRRKKSNNALAIISHFGGTNTIFLIEQKGIVIWSQFLLFILLFIFPLFCRRKEKRGRE